MPDLLSRRALLRDLLLASGAALISPRLWAQTDAPLPSVTAFESGQWFDGKRFSKHTFYAVGGVLQTRKPAKIDRTVDLENQFVIPPFGDAHTHNLDGTRGLAEMTQQYIAEGTFYVRVIGNHGTGAKAARPFLNKPSTLEVIYANGMLTCTYGHPFLVYEPLAMGIYSYPETIKRMDEIKKSRIAENDAYYFLDTKADVDAKWPRILSTRPDLIKIALVDAANWEKDKAKGDMVEKGLSPAVAAYVVQKAHQSGLRVYAHIDTADDFRLGLDIGLDGFAHAPYCLWNGSLDTAPQNDLTISDIKRAAKQNIVITPTAQISTYAATDYDKNGKGVLNKERMARISVRQKKLFNDLHKNGVRLALGLDNYGTTLRPEVLYFHENEIFDNATLLQIATETTPQTIFPGRKIGKLQTGYEASFLVLGGNPLTDFEQIKNIKLRVKQGVFLDAGDVAAP